MGAGCNVGTSLVTLTSGATPVLMKNQLFWDQMENTGTRILIKQFGRTLMEEFRRILQLNVCTVLTISNADN